jgi:hypothetical protein
MCGIFGLCKEGASEPGLVNLVRAGTLVRELEREVRPGDTRGGPNEKASRGLVTALKLEPWVSLPGATREPVPVIASTVGGNPDLMDQMVARTEELYARSLGGA